MPSVGLEPTRRMTPVPKTGTSTNSVTKAITYNIIIYNNIKKIYFFHVPNRSYSITIFLSIFFICFLFGNFFGLLIKSSTNQIVVLLSSILISEFIGYYNNRLKNHKLVLYFNICKRGFLLGIFVEAFKVGS